MPDLLAYLRSRSIQPWIILLVNIVICLTLMATSDSSGVELARQRTSDILLTLAKPFGVVPALISLNRENARLRAENARYLLEVEQAYEALSENRRLRDLLDFKENSTLQLTAGEVIATDPLPGVRSILLDIGTEEGITKNLAVISDLGLIGKVVQASENNCIVQVILDRNLGAAVRLSHSRVNGITRWMGHTDLALEGVPASTPVRIGEEVITSGLDGIFPEGIPVGVVISTSKQVESLFLSVLIEPAVNFATLEEVFVVHSPPTQVEAP